MKRKLILLMAIVMALMCFFAISVSAAEPSYADGEWIYAADGTTKLAIRDTDGNPLIWYMNGETLKWVRADQTDTTQSVYVKYSISSGGSGFDTSKLNPEKTLKDIDIYDNGTQIEGSSINSQIVLFNMEKLDVDAINGWLWGNKNGCCTLMRGIVFPSTLKGIGQEGFTNTKLVQIWNLENTQLYYINACGFAQTSTLTQEATGGVFKNPQTVDAAPISAQYSNIKVYVMSPVCTFNTCQKWYQLFRGCNSLEKIIVPSHFAIGFGEEAFRDTPNKYITFITGTEADATNMRDNTQAAHNGGFQSSKIISYETYLADKETYDNATNQAYIVYGYNFCEAFYDNKHDLDVSKSCLIGDDCKREECDYATTTEFTSHSKAEALIYANGFASEGVYKCYCTNYELCEAMDGYTVEARPAIFGTTGGYSTNATGGITGGWIVDPNLVKEYNDLNPTKPINFGVVMINPTYLNGNRFFNDDYEVDLKDGGKGAMMVPMSTNEYASFKFTVSGFTSDVLKDLELVITAYAYVEGEDVQFIQDETTKCKVSTLDYEDGSLYTINYNKTIEVATSPLGEYVVPSKEEDIA
ncbi:MAG: hypothetical protein IJF11_01695 [Clostridia bacterium]|nr:hypothetical protein [Clostridia bacterium]